jgi:hypothetical protein
MAGPKLKLPFAAICTDVNESKCIESFTKSYKVATPALTGVVPIIANPWIKELGNTVISTTSLFTQPSRDMAVSVKLALLVGKAIVVNDVGSDNRVEGDQLIVAPLEVALRGADAPWQIVWSTPALTNGKEFTVKIVLVVSEQLSL